MRYHAVQIDRTDHKCDFYLHRNDILLLKNLQQGNITDPCAKNLALNDFYLLDTVKNRLEQIQVSEKDRLCDPLNAIILRISLEELEYVLAV
jgi:hypothetical protein